jgi:hypothetical protein
VEECFKSNLIVGSWDKADYDPDAVHEEVDSGDDDGFESMDEDGEEKIVKKQTGSLYDNDK